MTAPLTVASAAISGVALGTYFTSTFSWEAMKFGIGSSG